MGQVVYSAIQPTGRLHLGNYLGAVRQWLALQRGAALARDTTTRPAAQMIVGLADMHALTSRQPASDLSSVHMMMELMACGMDPRQCIIKRQSRVAVALCFLSGHRARLGALPHPAGVDPDLHAAARQTPADDAVQGKPSLGPRTRACLPCLEQDRPWPCPGHGQGHRERRAACLSRSAGSRHLALQVTLSRACLSKRAPLLTSSLCPRSTLVPIGEDQRQHIELTRDLAEKFNRTYGRAYFPLPTPLILTHANRIMSLSEAGKKMSKSDPLDRSRINLLDPPDTIREKIKAALTDSHDHLSYDRVGRPAVANLLEMYSVLSGDEAVEAIVERYRHRDEFFLSLKTDLTDLILQLCIPIQSEWHRIRKDVAEEGILKILEEGEQRANEMANRTYTDIIQLARL